MPTADISLASNVASCIHDVSTALAFPDMSTDDLVNNSGYIALSVSLYNISSLVIQYEVSHIASQ